jgi:aspartate dehydrogenase|tara:strand:- start:3918 stop:4721 length:804 start_codon:yes stop_codon:yes gene_type:complete
MKIGIAGIGAIGLNVALSLDRQKIPGFQLVGFSARSKERAAEFNEMLSLPIPHYEFAELSQNCDLVIECLPPSLFKKLAIPVLKAGKILVALSASQLLKYDDLIDLAEEYGGQIIVPSGAMLGLDALKAVAVGELQSVMIETRKPVAGLMNSPYFLKKGIDSASIDKPKLIMSGTVSSIAKEFPANVNVAAAISLAGLGADRTQMEIWADPTLKRNMHTVRVVSDSSDFTMSIQNRPSDENPSTGRITPQSVIALLRNMAATLKVGT